MKANLENSPGILRSLIEKFTTVREAWYEADHQPPASPETSTREGVEMAMLEPAAQSPPALPSPRRPSPYGSSADGEAGSWSLSA